MTLDIVYEDDDLIVIDKPAGLVVHPSAGHAAGTLVNALIAHCGRSLSGIGGVKRPGIVHRLDKDTSGLLVVAKSDAAHQGSAEQFKSHGRDGRLHRSYSGVRVGQASACRRRDRRPPRTQPRQPHENRGHARSVGREAKTHYEVLDVFPGETPGGDVSLLRLVLETGRTHQIRVHLAHIGHPVLGDPTYGTGFKTRLAAHSETRKTPPSPHATGVCTPRSLHFEHPITGKKLKFNSKLPADLERLGEALESYQTGSPDKNGRSRRSNVREADATNCGVMVTGVQAEVTGTPDELLDFITM